MKQAGAALLSFSLWPLKGYSQTPKPLRISLPPTLDAVPIGFGLEKKVFANSNSGIELIGFTSTQQRNAAVLSGEIDGFIADITSAALLVGAKANVAITSTAFDPIDDTRALALLTHKFTKIKTLEELLKANPPKPIALIRISDMEFSTDQLIKSKGFKVDEQKTYNDWADFNGLQKAAELLAGASANVPAVALPEPFATLTEVVGNTVKLGNDTNEIITLSDYNGMDLQPGVVIFRKTVIGERAEQLKLFYKAYKESVDLINKSPTDEVVEALIKVALQLFFKDITREELDKNLPKGWELKFKVPKFPAPRALLRAEFEGVVEWALAKRYIKEKVAFESAVDHRFVT